MAGEALGVAARRLFACLEAAGLGLVLAESCTGGLACEAFTELTGSSRILWGGLVSYSIEAKIALLGVEKTSIDSFGIVSQETARAMARGGLKVSGLGERGISGAVTGYAGPGLEAGESAPGRVCCAWLGPRGREKSAEFFFPGDRRAVREAAAIALLDGIRALVETDPAGKGPRDSILTTK